MEHLFFLSGIGVWILTASIIMDFFLGDREDLPHPVRLIGAAIAGAEKLARATLLPDMVAGAIMSVCLSGGTYLFSWIVFHQIEMHLPGVFFFLSATAIYFCISLRCLADEALKVTAALEKGEIEEARSCISMLVSRDTSSMTEEDISRAVIETVAENLVDGIMSPFFYAALGGPALCLCFKTISTMDSMIGYRNSTYLYFGRTAARLDDIANFIPARLAAVIIAAVAPLAGSRPSRVLGCVSTCAGLHQSPNSGYPEAAFAAAIGVNLGGPVSYHGKLHDYPVINKAGKAPCIHDIRKAVNLMYMSSFLFYAMILIPGMAISLG